MLRAATLVFGCVACACQKPSDANVLKKYNITGDPIVDSTNAKSPTAFPDSITCKKPFVGKAMAKCSPVGGIYKLFGCSTLTYKNAVLQNGVIIGFHHKRMKADSLDALDQTAVVGVSYAKKFVQKVHNTRFRPPMESACKHLCFNTKLCSSTSFLEKEITCYIIVSMLHDSQLLEDSIKAEIEKPFDKKDPGLLRYRFIPVADKCKNNTICKQCLFEGQRCRRGNLIGLEEDDPADERQCKSSAEDKGKFTCEDLDKIIPECTDGMPAPETGCLCENILKKKIKTLPMYCDMGQFCTDDGCDDDTTATDASTTTPSSTTTTTLSATTTATPSPTLTSTSTTTSNARGTTATDAPRTTPSLTTTTALSATTTSTPTPTPTLSPTSTSTSTSNSTTTSNARDTTATDAPTTTPSSTTTTTLSAITTATPSPTLTSTSTTTSNARGTTATDAPRTTPSLTTTTALSATTTSISTPTPSPTSTSTSTSNSTTTSNATGTMTTDGLATTPSFTTTTAFIVTATSTPCPTSALTSTSTSTATTTSTDKGTAIMVLLVMAPYHFM